MFGHQDEPAQQQTDAPSDQQAPADNAIVVGDMNPALPPDPASFGAPAQPSDGTTEPASAAPAAGASNLLEPQATDGFVNAPVDPTPPTDSPMHDQPATVGTPSPLNDLKHQALDQLSPLVNHLDQTPEEKFRTTMMMIQASDNQDLLQTAYDAANQITDEKAKAQALLDVINEINYFTQKQKG
jgi:hypothetical protein